MATELRKPRVNVVEDDGRHAMSEREQEDAARELQGLQQQELNAKRGGVEEDSLQDIRARQAEIRADFSNVEAQAQTPDTVHREMETRVERAPALGRFADRVGVGWMAEAVGIRTRDTRVNQPVVDVQESQRMNEDARGSAQEALR